MRARRTNKYVGYGAHVVEFEITISGPTITLRVDSTDRNQTPKEEWVIPLGKGLGCRDQDPKDGGTAFSIVSPERTRTLNDVTTARATPARKAQVSGTMRPDLSLGSISGFFWTGEQSSATFANNIPGPITFEREQVTLAGRQEIPGTHHAAAPQTAASSSPTVQISVGSARYDSNNPPSPPATSSPKPTPPPPKPVDDCDWAAHGQCLNRCWNEFNSCRDRCLHHLPGTSSQQISSCLATCPNEANCKRGCPCFKEGRPGSREAR